MSTASERMPPADTAPNEEVEGPLEDARAVLGEPVKLEPSMLDESERLEVAEDTIAEAEQAARVEANREAEYAAEARAIIEPVLTGRPEESLTPEELEEEQEGAGQPAEASLHEGGEEEALVEALRDEGEQLEGFEEDLIEYEMERQEEAASGGC
jgi:hypothetical protein